MKRKEDLLIYRPFDRSLFTGGPSEGPELLLKTMRGENVEWASIEEKYTPRRLCTGCGFTRVKDEFIGVSMEAQGQATLLQDVRREQGARWYSA